ncbi:hypothetical protein B296_00024048 [Ensete ventricosum]|uniref:Uncharacterized protein n=1 Tax=Ensete ventricosum TaxID=4639 RepID=A0A426XQZ0_ENSVE|nr:hypothetical protein B296_00024048 [Ensete ventricosum]
MPQHRIVCQLCDKVGHSAKTFVLPALQAEATTVGERNCFAAEEPLQKSDSTNASGTGPCLLDVHEVDLEAAFGMRTYSEVKETSRSD